MEKLKQEIPLLAEEFKACQKTLLAIGDENRQHLILKMMQMERCSGVRVGEITACTNLSRPAVSHHLQILKECGLVRMRREGTKNYYFFNTDLQAIDQLITLFSHVKEVMQDLPEEKNTEDEDLWI